MVKVFMRETTQVGWGEESTPGSAPGSFYLIPGHILTIETPEPEMEFEPKYWENKFVPGLIIPVRKTVRGRIRFEPYSASMFKMALGTSSVAGGITTYKIAHPLPSFSLEIYNSAESNVKRQYRGVYVNRARFAVEEGGVFTTEFEILGLKPPVNSWTTPSGSRKNLATAYHTAVSIDGSEYQVTRWEVEINNNLEEKRYEKSDSGDGYPTVIVDKRREITGRLTVNPSDRKILDYLLDQSEIDIVAKISRDAATDYCEITAKDGKVRTAPHPVPEEGLTETEVNLVFKDLVIEAKGDFA